MYAPYYPIESTRTKPSHLFVLWQTAPVLLLIVFLLLPHAPQAETLRATANHWPPYISPKLPGRGLAMALVAEALKRNGYAIELRIEDLERALEGTRLGVYDLIVGVWQTEDRARELHFSEPFLTNDVRFITLAESMFEYEQVEDLQGLVIGTLNNYSYDTSFLDNNKLILVPRSHVLQNLNALLEGEIDLVVADRFTALHAINIYLPDSQSKFRFLKKPLEVRSLHIAVSRELPDHERIIENFNQTIKNMRSDGTYDAILRRYNF